VLVGLALVGAKRRGGLPLALELRGALLAAVGGTGMASESVELGESRGGAREGARSRLAWCQGTSPWCQPRGGDELQLVDSPPGHFHFRQPYATIRDHWSQLAIDERQPMPQRPTPERPDPTTAELLTEEATAELLHNSVSTLRRWRRLGIGPAFIKSGRKVLYRRVTLDRWLAEQETTSGE
jgi:hypothetical protein